MSKILLILLVFFMAAVLAVLVIGLISMVRGGDFDKKNSNRLMQLRVFLQAVALVLLGIIFFFAKN